VANVIDNTIMNSSVLWPTSSGDAAKRLPAGQLDAQLESGQSSPVLRSAEAESGRGWLPSDLGQAVDVMA